MGLALARMSAGTLARWAVPAIVVELVIGFLLGNTVLPFEAIQPISGLTELGVLTLFFQVGLEVRSDLLASRRGTILRLVALSCLAPLLGYWPLTQAFGMAPATALLCLACVAATGTGVTLRLLAQRGALRTPSGRLLVGVSVLDDLPAIGLLSLSVALGGSNWNNGPGWGGMALGLAAAGLSLLAAGQWRRRGGAAPASPLAVLILLIGSAWIGEVSGLTSLLGALWGGVLLNRLHPEPQRLGGLLTVLSEVFLPLYFISVGMRIQAGTLGDGAPFWLAGLWERWIGPDGSEVDSCCVLTTAPNALVAPLHDRMPVIVPAGLEQAWLDTKDGPGLRALEPLLQGWDPEGWRVQPKSRQPTAPPPSSQQLPLFS